MQDHGLRLRELLDDEGRTTAPGDDLGPSGEPAVRAHLRFVAEALAATAGPPTRAPLAAFAEGLPTALRAAGPASDAHATRARELAEAEIELQFGAGAADDPTTRTLLERRVRFGALRGRFLEQLDRAVGDGVAEATEAWSQQHEVRLAGLIYAMDRRAKQAETERGGPDAVGDMATVNRIGQAATLQASVRFLLEGVVAALAARTR
jgi:hypothetical protein